MILPTKNKVQLAAIASRAILSARSLAGSESVVRVRRGGLWWELDLREGIDFSIYLLGSFERSTARALRGLLKPGDAALDIGANIGAHTLGMAKSVGSQGRVIAFEPTDFAFAKLQRNLSLNPALQAQTRIVQMFLGADENTMVPAGVYAQWPLFDREGVHPKHRGRETTTRNAEIGTLDGFVLREGLSRIDLIKMDVDGHELPLLKGALQTLRALRPALVMEMSPYVHAERNQSFRELIELLANLDYSLTDIDSGRPVPLRAETLESLIPDGASINVIGRIPG